MHSRTQARYPALAHSDVTPEQIAVHFPTLSFSYVGETCRRYAGNIKKILHILDIAASRTTLQLTPSAHARGAACRPQGGDSLHWADTFLADYPEGNAVEGAHGATSSAIARMMQRIGAARLRLLGADPSRYCAHVDPEMEMFANNS